MSSGITEPVIKTDGTAEVRVVSLPEEFTSNGSLQIASIFRSG